MPDRNLYDDVEVRHRSDVINNTVVVENAASRSDVRANDCAKVNAGHVTNNENDVIDSQQSSGSADHRLQRTVALMWCWALAVGKFQIMSTVLRSHYSER